MAEKVEITNPRWLEQLKSSESLPNAVLRIRQGGTDGSRALCQRFFRQAAAGTLRMIIHPNGLITHPDYPSRDIEVVFTGGKWFMLKQRKSDG